MVVLLDGMNARYVFGMDYWYMLMCYLNDYQWIEDHYQAEFNVEIDLAEKVPGGISGSPLIQRRADFSRYYSYMSYDAKGLPYAHDVVVELLTNTKGMIRIRFMESNRQGWETKFDSEFFAPRSGRSPDYLRSLRMVHAMMGSRGLV